MAPFVCFLHLVTPSDLLPNGTNLNMRAEPSCPDRLPLAFLVFRVRLLHMNFEAHTYSDHSNLQYNYQKKQNHRAGYISISPRGEKKTHTFLMISGSIK